MSGARLTPRCPDCKLPIPPTGPMCPCLESRLPQMELHRSETLARKLVYLEAMVLILVDAQVERNRKRKPRAAKRAESRSNG